MAQVNLPVSLGFAFWDKQKAALAKAPKAPDTKLGDELKTLTKLHLGVEWGDFGDDKLDTADKAKARLSAADDAVKGKVKVLLEQTRTIETVAAKFETDAKKDKQFPKEPLVAVTAILKAVKEYRAEVESFVAAARKTLAAKVEALVAQQKKAAPTGHAAAGAESKAAKLVRMRGLDAIRKIKKPAPGAKPLRFMIVQGKLTVATYMGPSVGPAQEKLLKSLIPTEAPFKIFKDPVGELAWEKNAVTFVSDHLPAGLVKKMQLWLKKILKLNLKLRVRKTSGEAEESEGEDIADDMLKLDPAEAAAKAQAIKGFHERLAKMQPDIRKGMTGPSGDEIKELVASVLQHSKTGAYDDADAELDEIEALLEEGGDEGSEAKAEAASGGDAMADWQAARATALASLKAVATKIGAAKHASSTKAIIEISAVMKNISAAPSSLQQVTELQHYLGSDDVVNDVCELAEDIRTPLLRVLGRLRAQVAA
jgi:hypothetical protein